MPNLDDKGNIVVTDKELNRQKRLSEIDQEILKARKKGFLALSQYLLREKNDLLNQGRVSQQEE